MNTTFIIYFRNHDTFLCIFNYKVDAEIARYWKLKLFAICQAYEYSPSSVLWYSIIWRCDYLNTHFVTKALKILDDVINEFAETSALLKDKPNKLH